MALAQLSTGFQSLPPIPTSKVGSSGADCQVGGLVYVLGPCGSLQQPLLWGWESLLLLPQPPWAFSIRGLRLYFPELAPWFARSALLPTSLTALLSATLSPALSVYLCANVGPQGLLVLRLPVQLVPHSASLGSATATRVLSTPVPVSPHPPAWMNVYFLFPWCGPHCRSILCQFWLCEEVQCVYLHRHLGSPLFLLFLQ